MINKSRIKNYDSVLPDGGKIKGLIAGKGMEQKEFAEKYKLKFGTLKKIIQGIDPVKWVTFKPYADALGVDPRIIITKLIGRDSFGNIHSIEIVDAIESSPDAIRDIKKNLDADLSLASQSYSKISSSDIKDEFTPMERFIIDTIVGGHKTIFSRAFGRPRHNGNNQEKRTQDGRLHRCKITHGN